MARSSTFTTYFNSEVDTTGGAKLQALASTATQAYDQIASAAQRAAQATYLVGGSGSGGLNAQTASLTRQAAAARQLGQDSLAAGSATDRFTAAASAAGKASAVAAVENEALNASLKSTATALAVIQGPLGPVAGRIRALAGAVGEFSVSTLGLLGAGGALFAIASIGNQYANLESKLRPFFNSQVETNNALAEVVGIAQSSRAALEPIADLYVRLTTLQKELGQGTNVASLATTIAKASTLSGGSSENQAEGIRQLTQGLGRGILNGQDLRALEEDSFNLAKTIADGLGVNVGQLKALGQQGALTTDVVVQALTRESAVVDAQFAKLPVTLTSAGREFKNASEVFVGGLDQASGLTSGLAAALQALATHIQPIASIGVALGAAFAVPKAGGALLGYIDTVTASLASKNALINQTNAAVDAGTAFEITAEGKAAALAATELELAVVRHQAAVEAREDAQANIAFAQQEEAEIEARIALIQQAATVQQQAAVEEIASLQAVVAERQAALEAFETEIAQRTTVAATLARAQPLLQSQAADPTNLPAQAELAAQTQQAADNQTALSRAQVLSTAAAQDLTAAQEQLAAAYQQVIDTSAEVQAGIDAELSLNASLVEAKLTLAAAEGDAATAAATEAVALTELTAAETALEAATAAAAAVQGGFLAALDGILALLNPVAIGIGLATAAVIYYSTKTSELDDVISGLNARQKDQIDLIGKATVAYEQLSVAALKAARDQEQGKIAPAAQAYSDARSSFISNLQSAQGSLSSSDPRYAQLGTIISNYVRGASAQSTYSAFSDLGLGSQSSSKPGLLGQAGAALGANVLSSSGLAQVANSFIDVQKAATAAGDVVKNVADANTALANAGKPLPPILDGTARSLSQIKTDAAALADNGTAVANEDAQHKKALADLDAKYGKGGAAGEDGTPAKALSGEQAAAAQAAYEAEDKRHNQALANIQSEKQAAHAAATEAKNDALGNAETEKLTSLIALEKNRSNLTVDEYNSQKEAIDARYDAEKARIEANGSQSHTSLTQQLADLEKLNQAYDKQSNAIAGFSGKYVDQPKPEAQYDAAVAKLRQNEGVTDASGRSASAPTEAAIAASVSPVQKALNDYERTVAENNVVGTLAAQGLTAQASALKEALDLQRTQGSLTQDQVAALVSQAAQEERINEIIADRQTITNNLLGLVDSTKETLATLLENFSSGPGKAIGTAVTSLETNLKKVFADNIATSLFSGATGAVKQLFQSNSPADVAQRKFAATIDATTTTVDTANSSYADTVNRTVSITGLLNQSLTDLNTNVRAVIGGGSGTTATGIAGLADTSSSIATLLAPPASLDASATGQGLLPSLYASSKSNGFDLGDAPNQEIVVTAAKTAAQAVSKTGSSVTSPVTVLNAAGSTLATNINKGLSGLLKPLGSIGTTISDAIAPEISFLGKNLGTAVQGAGIGATAGSLFFGNNQSSTGKIGDQLGGAIGDVAGKALQKPITSALSDGLGKSLGGALGSVAPVIGSVIGTIAGGLLGGLFAKKIQGGATITANQYGDLSSSTTSQSNSSKAEAAATSEASTVSQGIQQVASTLGAQITGSPNITVGTYKGNYRVNTQGTKLGGSSSPVPGLTDFGDDESAAVQYAIVESIQKGVISGISQASINILKSGQDLNTALQKALTIENIPKQLEQLTDPVKYAVDTLNEQFQTVISDLNEGGASAAQYSQAQELYDKERATAIEQAAKSVFSTVEDYITEITSGTSSPLNKSTTLSNAQAAFDVFAKQIDAGQSVDQDDLVTAAKNLQSAASASYGSSTSFFSVYDDIVAELKKADATATADVDTSADQDLPASPFTTDSTAASELASVSKSYSDATTAQTTTLMSGFDAVVDAINSISSSGLDSSTKNSAVGLLTGVKQLLS